MFKKISIEMRSSLKKEITSHIPLYTTLFIMLSLALFVRTYRLHDLLGFYYDQGRDALVIWKLWHEGKFFLIGPVTGLSGIFLGPFYYYLIAPLYLFGQGDPVVPAFFLAATTVLALIILYYLAVRMHSRAAGLISLIIGGFSYYFVISARWLSNPTPMFFLSMLLLWMMWEIIIINPKSKLQILKINKLWILTALLIGISMHFESASAVFYIPMITFFAWWQRRKFPDKKTLFLAFIAFLTTLLPQVLFNFRHQNLLFDNFVRVIIEERSFRNPFGYDNLSVKLNYFWTVFSSKIFPLKFTGDIIYYTISVLGLWKLWKNKSEAFKLVLIFLGIPMVGYFFFQGNHGNIYDYYMTGYYFPMILLFSLGLAELWKNYPGKLFVTLFLIVFLNLNIKLINKYLNSPIGGPDGVGLGNELQAVNWVLDNGVKVEGFNMDVYVPPVIAHSYDYLFLWQGTEKCGPNLCGMSLDNNYDVLYTIYENDPAHPERLMAWLERQKGIAKVKDETEFAAITVQKRTRY